MLSGVNIKKLSLQNNEIEVSDKSVLNEHLDEILYFFEATKYNVVVIEDLDRYGSTKIFEKLREINLLINNSKQINKRVIFIYAVKDEIFSQQNKDRTKFFDFVIPVIPVVDSSNSGAMLIRLFKENKFEISEDLLDNISLFIDDMRLINNIFNEFHLYENIIGKNLDKDKLLAMIIYKNLFHADFVKLNRNEGVLYSVLSNKHQYIAEKIKEADKKIENIRTEIKDAQNIQIENVEKLNMLFLTQYLEHLNNFSKFIINGNQYSIRQAAKDDIFVNFIKNTVAQYLGMQSGYSSQRVIPFNIRFESIESEMGEYYQAERTRILKKHSVEKLQGDIAKLEIDKQKIKSQKLVEIFKDTNIPLATILGLKQKQLIILLIKNGYINEDYKDYISVFHEGSLTKLDQEFILRLKTKTLEKNYDYKLTNPDKVIDKIHVSDFKTKEILNYYLVSEILENNSNYAAKRDAIFEYIISNSNDIPDFIMGYLDTTDSPVAFIKLLAAQWSSFWEYIESQTKDNPSAADKYLSLLITHANNKDIVSQNKNLQVSNYIESLVNIDQYIPQKEKFQDLIKKLIIKFEKLDISSLNSDMFDFIYNGNYYAINPQMMENILERKEHFNSVEFENKNWSYISNLEHSPGMTKYISENINKYIEEIYLKTNIVEELELLNILKEEGISMNNKEKIIENAKVKIKDISEITDATCLPAIIKNCKCFPTWNNVFTYFKENDKTLSEELISFIINQENNILLDTKIIASKGENSSLDYFIEQLILSDISDNNIYQKILNIIPYIYNELSFENLSVEKVKSLVKMNKLSLNESNFNKLKNNFSPLNIILLKVRYSDFIKNPSNFLKDQKDIVSILKDDIFSVAEKNQIINWAPEQLVLSDIKILETVGELVLSDNSFIPNDNIMKAVLQNRELYAAKRIIIFNRFNNILKIQEITNFLNIMGAPYSEIAKVDNSEVCIANTQEHRIFLNILKQRGYIEKSFCRKLCTIHKKKA